MLIKPIMSYHLTFVRIAVIKTEETTMLMKMWRKGNPCALMAEMYIGVTTMPTSLWEKHFIVGGKPLLLHLQIL